MPEDPQLEMRTLHSVALEEKTKKRLKEPVLIDMMTGKVYKITEVSKKFLKGLPLTDYPLFVTDLNAISDIFVPMSEYKCEKSAAAQARSSATGSKEANIPTLGTMGTSL